MCEGNEPKAIDIEQVKRDAWLAGYRHALAAVRQSMCNELGVVAGPEEVSDEVISEALRNVCSRAKVWAKFMAFTSRNAPVGEEIDSELPIPIRVCLDQSVGRLTLHIEAQGEQWLSSAVEFSPYINHSNAVGDIVFRSVRQITGECCAKLIEPWVQRITQRVVERLG